jgi:tRNA nucleotidyltransferase/poly(A) polymerase
VNAVEGASLRDVLLETFSELRSIPPPAWIVGGAIRDLLLGRRPADIDLAAEEGFEAAKALAAAAGGRLVPLGRERFPTWRIVAGERACDISDVIGETIDHDLGRRDFTINALALPLFGPEELLDPFRGAADIRAGVIRMVARKNLAEDPLRALKAVRLAATLGFAIEPETLAACRDEAHRLELVAAERTGAELEMMFTDGAPALAAPLLRETGMDVVLFGRTLPGYFAKLEPGDPIVAWTAIYRAARADEVRSAARKLRWASALATAVSSLLRALAAAEGAVDDPVQLDRVLHEAGPVVSARVARLSSAAGEERVAAAVNARIAARGEELFSIRPILNGDEIRAAAGIGSGPEIGTLKKELLREQIAGRIASKNDALAWLRSRLVSR